jgi:methyl-accepting chemotaxis protein
MMMLMVVISGIILSPVLLDMFMSNDLDTQYTSAQKFLSLAKQVVPAVIILFILFFIHLTIITHKICGPLINFTKTFSKISRGDFSSKVKLRKGDYLKYECDKINEMIDSLSASIRSARENQTEIVDTLEAALKSIDDPELSDKIRLLLGKLRS